MFPVVLIMSLLFAGIDRKLHARMQRRIGPPITQPINDFIKLLNKERIVPMTASSSIFTSVPVIAAASAILAATIQLVDVFNGHSFVGDLILILYLLAMSSILVMIGGSSSGNPYGAIGFSRKMTLLIGYEVPILISVVSLSLKSGFSLAYYDIIMAQTRIGTCFAFSTISASIAAIAYLLCVPAGTGILPFDIPEAKTEVAHGPLIEYGGPYLALMMLTKDVNSFALTFLGLTLFFYLPALLGPFVLEGWMKLGLCLIGALAIMVFVMTIPRTIFARFKLGPAFKFLLVPWILSTASLALSLIGM
jgi:NADH-quinone oxidoreductase subunit H